MRRLLAVALPLLAAPASALAADAFCTGLSTLVAAASQGFDYLPRGGRLLPGSIEERRGITRTGDGPPRAVFFAVMLRDPAAQHPNPVQSRFRALQTAIGQCLPEAEARPAADGQGGAVARWSTQQALIELRRDDGSGGLSSAEVEISIASRW